MACLVRVVTAVALVVLAGAVFVPTVQAACSSPVLRGANLVVSCPAVASEQAFVVPAGVSTLRVIAVGAKGDRGGTGAVAGGELRVTPGSTLYVLVGGDGRPGQFDTGVAGPGGFNGGGSGGSGAGSPGGTAGLYASAGGGGGGASDLRTCSVASRSCDTLASRLIVAAGGGGSGGGSVLNDFSTTGAGGAGGTQGSGSDGMASVGPSPGAGGAGATATAGGRGGSTSAAAGASGAGGRGADAVPGPTGSQLGSGGAGGGGGGGLFGGGGGGAGGDDLTAGAGGGGGSSFGPAGTTFASASLRPPGSVTIAYAARPPAVVVRRPRAGQLLHRFDGRGKTRKRRQLVISGRAFDPAGVQGVALTLERLPRRTTSGGRCTWLHPTRGLRRSSCNRPPPLIATLGATGSWTYRLSKRIKLLAGRYRVSAYGKNTPGLFGNSAPRHARIVTFRLSQR